MKAIRIARLSGGQTLYNSFSLDSFTEIKAEKDYVYLFFKSLIQSSTFVSNSYYYGTKVTFTKSNLGYQLYEAIIQIISDLNETNIVTIDYTQDDLVTISFDEIYGTWSGGTGGGGSDISISGPSGVVTTGATGIYFTGSGVSSVTSVGDFVTVTISASGTSGTSGSSGTSGTSGSGTSGTSGSSGTSGTSGTSGLNGSSGTSGSSGFSGTSGSSGTSGISGTSGTSGTNGSSGTT